MNQYVRPGAPPPLPPGSIPRSSSRSHRKQAPLPPKPALPVAAPHHGQVQTQHAQAAHAQAQAQMDKRYIRRPVEKNIPSKIEALIPDAKLFRELREVEQNMDATISRKRLDTEDTLAKGTKERKKLRIFISNTVIDQPWQTVDRIDENAFDFDIGTIPSWLLRIEGKLLDDSTPIDSPHRRKFTSFFQSIAIELDRPKDLYPDGNIVVWNQQTKPGLPPQPMSDSVDIKRKGDTDINARISFYLATSPERFKLSAALSTVLGGLKEQTRQEVVMGLWQYIKSRNLQDPDEKRTINCDDALRQVFNNQDRISFAQMIEYAGPHLLPLDPIVIDYTVRVDRESTQAEFAYDIDVEVDSPQRQNLQNVLANWHSNQDEIHALDDQIGITIQELLTAKLRRDFFTQMAHDPAGFINRWIGSQSRDLEIVLGDRDLQSEEVRRAGFYGTEDLTESIFLLLNSRK
ncbi:hypothetical protein V1517DRAFT_326520 [Lipomyces orientalis]|uniref:Uncharacterized protein n=1 Tax=Lipomyces orientalis TaxID=1233043 RepID=A0ACC3TJN5_9ASCO